VSFNIIKKKYSSEINSFKKEKKYEVWVIDLTEYHKLGLFNNIFKKYQ
jgi:hypothetical protein